MLDQIKRYARTLFAPPVFEDEGKTRTARQLNAVLLTLLISIVPISATYYLMFSMGQRRSPWMTVGYTLSMVGLLILLRRGRVSLASMLTSSVLLALITLNSWQMGGIMRTPSTSGYFLVVIVAGLLLGRRGVIIFSGLSIAAIGGLLYKEFVWPTVAPPRTATLYDGLLWGILLGMGGLLLHLVVGDIRQALECARCNEQALRQSEYQHRAILDAMGDAIHVIDADMRFILLNRTFKEWNANLGLRTEVLGQNVFEVFPFLPNKARDEYEQVFSSGCVLVTEEVSQVGSRSIITETRKIPVCEGQSVSRVVTVVRDITQSKQAEQARQESQRRLHMALSSAPIVLFTLNRAGLITFVGGKALAEIGFKPSDLVGRSAFDIYPGYPHNRQNIQRALDGQVFKADREMDGLWFEFRIAPLVDEKGDFTEIMGVATDITERVQAVAALQQRTAQLETLRQLGLELTAQLDVDALTRVITLRTSALLEAAHSRLYLHRPKQDVLDGQGPQGDFDQLKRGQGLAGQVLESNQAVVINDYSPLAGEYSAPGPMAAVGVPVQWRATGDALSLGVLCAWRETTRPFSQADVEWLDMIATRAALALNNAHLVTQVRRDAEIKTALLHEVNHRVKNNLASIMGILSLEAQRHVSQPAGSAGSDLQASLQTVQNRVWSIATAHDMLSASEWGPLPISQLVTQIVHAALSGSPLRHQVHVTLTAPPQPIYIASEQATALALIINELTTNSIKHAFSRREHGRLDIRIGLESGAALAKPQVKIVFRDDGPGWPEDVLAGQRQSVGLLLVRTNARSPLRGTLDLQNEGGAVTILTFRPASVD